MSRTIPLTMPLPQRFDILRGLAAESSHNKIVIDWAEDLARFQTQLNWLMVLHRAVFRLPLTIDPPGVDVYRSGLETLVEGGDCASKSILLSALILGLFRRKGVSVVVAFVWEHSGSTEDHVRLAVQQEGGGWVLLDALAKTVGIRAVNWVPQWHEYVII